MSDPIPKNVKKLWDNWNVRGVILFSLTLQTLLVLFAPLRKATANKLVIIILWSAYLLADWSANFAVGLISDSQGDDTDASTPEDNPNLLALWAPFLLLHLGGPDTITAFALEDNELWLRHLLGLVFQAVAAVYVFLQSFPNKLIASTLLMFLAGVIKYIERTRALYLASLDRFRDSMLDEPDPGPNYAKLMEEFASKKEANLPTKIITIVEPDEESNGTAGNGTEEGEKRLTDLDVVHYGYKYFNIFKGLIVDLIFSFQDRNESRAFFRGLAPESAMRVIEVELNFIYETLYTKVEVVHSVMGYIARFIAFGSVVAALSLFRFKVRNPGFDDTDVRITYVLFFGALGLDTIALLMLLFSDRTYAALVKRPERKSPVAAILNWFLVLKRPRWSECQISQNPTGPKHNILVTPRILRRWSGSVSGHNLVRFCLKGRPTRFYKVKSCFHCPDIGSYIYKVILFLRIDKIIEWVGLTDYVDEIIYVSREPFAKELWEFIFDELKGKSKLANSPEDAKRISSAKGDWILQENCSESDCKKLNAYVTDVAYDESILLWHIATELLYQTEEEVSNDDVVTNNAREFSKILSDYMLYLLVMQPAMMSAVAGIGKIRFRDTCAEASRFFERKKLKSGDDKFACTKILDVKTFVVPVSVKGDKSKSVLFDASMLAQVLKEMHKNDKKGKWMLISKVWVEMLSFAASHCIARTHAQQVSKGGELISFLWLLMAHFGLGEQFKINKGQGRTKLIVAK